MKTNITNRGRNGQEVARELKMRTHAEWLASYLTIASVAVLVLRI
jgi:hypothetical protein